MEVPDRVFDHIDKFVYFICYAAAIAKIAADSTGGFAPRSLQSMRG